jgi:hypothetical protein
MRSRGKRITIADQGWTGDPITILPDDEDIAGTELAFADEPWTKNVVEPLAVFTGLRMTVDGDKCAVRPFIEGDASHHRELGCRIQVIDSGAIGDWRRQAAESAPYGANLYINFHGQVVATDYHVTSEHHLAYLVDLTGEPTGIRLMLPARTRLIENAALGKLKDALERETYLHLQRQGKHRLAYRDYLRARDLGIELPESEPVYRVGLLTNDGYGVEPIEVAWPEGFDLKRCHRYDQDRDDDLFTGEANVHLLAALGAFDRPLVPVAIGPEYDGYQWANLPRIVKVEVEAGRELLSDWVWSGLLIGVNSLRIKVHAADGAVFASNVCMAVKPCPPSESDGGHCFSDNEVYVTPAAREQLCAMDIWRHLGGYNDGGDTWDTQEYDFGRELQAFWAQLDGPDEPIRRDLFSEALRFGDQWRSITLHRDGRLNITHTDGTTQTIAPPPPPEVASPAPPEASSSSSPQGDQP